MLFINGTDELYSYIESLSYIRQLANESALNIEKTQDINIEYKDDYGSLAVFISSILLSAGGFLGIIISAIHTSRCTSISIFGSKCTRSLPSTNENSV